MTDQMEIFLKLTIATLFLQSTHGLESDIGSLECSPIDHEIHLQKSSSQNLIILCNLTGCI